MCIWLHRIRNNSKKEVALCVGLAESLGFVGQSIARRERASCEKNQETPEAVPQRGGNGSSIRGDNDMWAGPDQGGPQRAGQSSDFMLRVEGRL